MAGEVKIHRYQLSDADDLVEAARESTREVFPWIPWCHPGFSHEEASRWIQAQIEAWEARRAFEFCIRDADGAYLGGCGLNQVRPDFRFANLGYWVRTSATRRGVAVAAVHQLAEFARAETHLNRLEIVIAVGNHASARVAQKAGALLEGTLRSRLFFHGTAHDAWMYSLIIR